MTRGEAVSGRPRALITAVVGVTRAVALIVTMSLVGAACGSSDSASTTPDGVPGDTPFREGGLTGAVGTLETTTTLPPQPNFGFRTDGLYVALYGRPGTATLGVLGEQPVEAAVQRAQQVAATYAGFGRTVIASFEIITTVASFEAGDDGDYSNEPPPSDYQEWIDAALASDMHVIIDLQSGRSTFPDQAAQYESLLLQPNVSLAIDPEWRVGPTERPGNGRIGTVTGAEVNATVDYLDDLIRRNGLPSKMLVVHQFRPSMVTDRQIVRGTDKVQVIIQMDGFGPLDLKQHTYSLTTAELPVGVLPGGRTSTTRTARRRRPRKRWRTCRLRCTSVINRRRAPLPVPARPEVDRLPPPGARRGDRDDQPGLLADPPAARA